MRGMAKDDVRVISRRDLLRGAAIAGGAATLGGGAMPPGAEAAGGQRATVSPPPAREAFENLTAAEADLLEAIVSRLIPTDENGPGATEARAAHYIDRALGSALAASRQAYRTGLAALDRYAAASRGKSFLQLSPSDQDAVLTDCEAGRATEFPGSSTSFFNLVLTHTRQGTFGDPYYGGNANFVGWDLLGYPGVRTMATAADQKALESGTLKPVRRSAYDYEGFHKATVDATTGPDGHHGH